MSSTRCQAVDSALEPDTVTTDTPFGEVPEWPNGAVSKTVVDPVSTVGSNPTLSAGS